MKFLIPLFSIPLLALLMSMSCNKNKDRGNRHIGDCPPNLACTMEFRYIHITITDHDGNPVALDKFRTVRIADGHEFDLQADANHWEDSTWKATGSYPLLTDGQQKQISTRGETVEFRGEKNGVVIVQEQYEVRDDCCHIDLVSGNRNITVP